MFPRSPRQTPSSTWTSPRPHDSHPWRLGQILYRWRLERGWNLDHLARQAGLSRTTLHGLEAGTILRPRAATLSRLAEVFGVPVTELSIPPEESVPAETLPINERTSPSSTPDSVRNAPSAQAVHFDRQTNPRVDEVAQREPHLFEGWSTEDWDQLYSTFGVGGNLSETGVRVQAERINRQREVTFKLQLVLQTHLAETAEEFVNRLYRMATGETPEPGTEPLAEAHPSCRSAGSSDDRIPSG